MRLPPHHRLCPAGPRVAPGRDPARWRVQCPVRAGAPKWRRRRSVPAGAASAAACGALARRPAANQRHPDQLPGLPVPRSDAVHQRLGSAVMRGLRDTCKYWAAILLRLFATWLSLSKLLLFHPIIKASLYTNCLTVSVSVSALNKTNKACF